MPRFFLKNRIYQRAKKSDFWERIYQRATNPIFWKNRISQLLVLDSVVLDNAVLDNVALDNTIFNFHY
ncbi:MAG: hypothetical protein DRR08_04330 [Candidatus Parabeggiatoa sp. nov. 2]|nr:MAG: hypothetical protein B6247_09765 [Beggiatoa sp. 4572_84]RKZ63144.1 MAG: hypothetical protein DRR08_04330 [Gammaproteobacteria bacterium]